MEPLNSDPLRSIIGNARIQNVGDTELARFSVASDLPRSTATLLYKAEKYDRPRRRKVENRGK
jgi:hypothetical protein